MIKMSEDEMKAFESDAEKITQMADALAMLDLEAKAKSPIMTLPYLRADEPSPYGDPAALVNSAPENDGTYVVAPKTFTEGS